MSRSSRGDVTPPPVSHEMKMKKSIKKVSWSQAVFLPPCCPYLPWLFTAVCRNGDAHPALKLFYPLPSFKYLFPLDSGTFRGKRDAAPGSVKLCFALMTQINLESFFPVFALDDECELLFCLRTVCWHHLSQCQLYSCLRQGFLLQAVVPRLPSPMALASTAVAVCSFSLFFDHSATYCLGKG